MNIAAAAKRLGVAVSDFVVTAQDTAPLVLSPVTKVVQVCAAFALPYRQTGTVLQTNLQVHSLAIASARRVPVFVRNRRHAAN